MSTVLDRLTERTGFAPRPSNDNHLARCPAHDDQRPSLSIAEKDDGTVLVNCFAGCATDAVLDALDLTKADLYPDSRPVSSTVAEYRYEDEQGRLLFVVERRAGKKFVQKRPDGDGWAYVLGDVRRVPYRLPALLRGVQAGETVYVVEGERDVHAVEAVGGVATCNPGGAGKWRPEYAKHLRGAAVVIVADKDEPGRKHAEQVRVSLVDVAESVTIVEARTGKDAADHFAAGHTLADFVRVGAQPLRERFLTVAALRSLRPPAPLVDGLLYRGTLAQESGPPGSYKTYLTLGMACAVSAGVSWEGHCVPEAMPVLYVAAEGAAGLARRIDAWCESNGTEVGDFRVLPEPLQLGNDAQVRALTEIAGDTRPGLIVFDTRARCTVGLDENGATEQGIAIEAAERIRRASGGTVLVVHHSGRNGEHGRGSNAWDGAAWSLLTVTGADLSARVKVDKHKDAPDGMEFKYRLLPHVVSEDRMPGEPETRRRTLVAVQSGGVDVLGPNDRATKAVLDVIRTCAGPDGLSTPQLADMVNVPNVGRTLVYEAVNVLLTRGLLHNVGGVKRPRYVLAGPALFAAS